MHLVIKILFFIILASFSPNAYSQYTTSVIPITKDEATSLHKLARSFRLRSWDGEPYLLLDLEAPFTEKQCSVITNTTDIPPCGLEEGCRFPLKCDNPSCQEAESYFNPTCPALNFTCEKCEVTSFNPVSNTCNVSLMTTDLFNAYLTDGRNPSLGPNQPFGYYEYVISCASKSLVASSPGNITGVAAFSWSGLAFPRKLSFLDNAEKFALCLPGTTSGLGVTFLGDGPYYFTSDPNLDLGSVLSYTPMVRKSSKSLGYYIKINRISIKGASISVPKSSSVKLSSRVPYTVLRSDIYNALIAGFSKATVNIPKVTAVKPFGLCVKDSAIGTGGVPKIDLETESGKVWSISGENSMKRVGNGVACLAFVDGGSRVADAIVMGTFQMEDNFLLFDLGNQKLGFSSSLLSRGTSCSKFNFTEVAN